MTTNRNEPFWIDLGFLPVEIAYVPNRKAWRKAHRQHDMALSDYPTTDGHVHWIENTKTNKSVILITVGPRARRHTMTQLAGIIAHEALHAVRYIMEAIGEKHPSAEFEAYMIQTIVQSTLFAHQQRRRNPWKTA